MEFERDTYMKWVLTLLFCIIFIVSPAIAESPTTISPSTISAPTVLLSDGENSIGSISVSNLNDVENIYLTLKYDPTIGVVETIKPNTSVISNVELVIDSQTNIYNGGWDAGTINANLLFSEGVSIQNSTPILDVIFRPTNTSGEMPLTLKSPYGTIYSDYLKIGATEPVRFDQCSEGTLISDGLGDPFPYRGAITAPKFVLEPGYTEEGSIYVEDLENICRLYVRCTYNAGIYPDFEVNQSFTELQNTGHSGGSGGETSYRAYPFESTEDVSIIEPRAVVDLSITSPHTDGYWNLFMDPYCSYTIWNDEGIPVQYPFKNLNDGGVQVISKSTDTTIQIQDITLSSNQSVAGIVEVNNLTDVKNIYFTLEYDPTIGVVETIRPNSSVISNVELLVDSQTEIYNGGWDAGTVRATLQFPDSVSIQNSTPILDVIFRPTNTSGEMPLTLKSPYGTIYSDYLKIGATEPVRFDQCSEGTLISDGLGDPFPYRGAITAPKFVLEPGYTEEGSIYVEDLENICRLYVRCTYNAGIYPYFEVNQSFTELKNTGHSGGSGGETSHRAYPFSSTEDVSIIEPRAVVDLSITSPHTDGYWNLFMDPYCSYTIWNDEGIPVQYPFKTLNDGSVTVISKSTDTTIQIGNVTLSSNQSSVGIVEANNLTDVKNIYFTLEYDPTIGVVETIRPNSSVISNVELLVDSQTQINNGGWDAGTVRATLQFPDSVSIQNSTPILDVIFRPTNTSGEMPLTLKSPYGTIYSDYLKIGATEPVRFDQCSEGTLISNGLGDPFPYRGAITAPKFVLEPGYTEEGSIYIEDLENICRLYVRCTYNAGIYPDFEVNQSFTELKNTGHSGGSGGETSYRAYPFSSTENVSIIEPRAVLDMSITAPHTDGYWNLFMDPYCSYTIVNDEGIPVQYPFKIRNDGSIRTIIYGDANGDGVVNQADTLNLLKIITGIIPHPSNPLLIEQSDVHKNGVIDVGDAMFIAQYNVGLRDQWFEVTAG
ncbi:MAG: dockerin type I repeat-containing protein [Methanoculleus sp.]